VLISESHPRLALIGLLFRSLKRTKFDLCVRHITKEHVDDQLTTLLEREDPILWSFTNSPTSETTHCGFVIGVVTLTKKNNWSTATLKCDLGRSS
jgi:hypothetical protein